MKYKNDLTQDLLQERYQYKDGKLFWKIKPYKSRVNVGDRVGTLHHSGYRVMTVGGKQYAEHRLIYLHQNVKMKHLGCYTTEQEAGDVYADALLREVIA